MGQTYPSNIPSYPDTQGGETLHNAGAGKGLSQILDDYGLDLTAATTKIGTGASTPTDNKVLVGDGVGTSTWSASLSGLTLSSPTINTPTITTPKIDTIAEETAANGVTIDGLNIKDGLVTGGVSTGISNSSLNTTSGELGGTWKSWTPTWTNLDIAKATLNYAKYMIIGKTLFYRLKITFTDAAISGDVTFTAPNSFNSDYSSNKTENIGMGVLTDSGTASYLAVVSWSTGGVMSVRSLDAGGTPLGYGVSLSATVPFTWANLDSIKINGIYEIA